MLKKLAIAPIIVLLLAPIGYAFQEPAPWQSFTSPEGRFSVLMPNEPKAEVKDVDSQVGNVKLYTYASSSKVAHMMASYGDYPKEPIDAAQTEQVVDGVREGVLKSLEAEILTANKIVLRGPSNSGAAVIEYPGREFTAKRIREGSEFVFSWKIYLVGRRVYQLAVVTSKADAASPDIQKFLTSFQLTN